ncbi:MAG TPA: tetratricopeptide repeat protein [Candidatus Acidoferrum sp.]|nr:tetratricopeptide repeat protein [Candidatus Acidoferrum sp.]
MTGHIWPIVRDTISAVLIFTGLVALVVNTVRKSEDPPRMILKWCVTLATAPVFIFVALPAISQPNLGAMFGLAVALLCGIAMAITWRRNIAGLVADPIASLYDGGTEPPDPHPTYSIAQARQKKGQYLEAIAEIRKQLDRFPTDVEGQLLLAQVQAEDLKDLPAAELTIQHFCDQPGHASQNVVFALFSLADWQLKVGQDREAARRALQQILDRYPESEFAPGAAHRLAHLDNPEMVFNPEDHRKYLVAEGDQHIGLLPSSRHLVPVGKDPQQQAEEYVKHLEQHPLDTDAREKLAVIYADHYNRLDLATDQLEQLIQDPAVPAKFVVQWLNLLADLQIRSGATYETVRETLERIVDRDPNLAAAEMARHRIALLRLELKAKQPNQAVKLGSYEQNIGLTRARGKPV